MKFLFSVFILWVNDMWVWFCVLCVFMLVVVIWLIEDSMLVLVLFLLFFMVRWKCWFLFGV